MYFLERSQLEGAAKANGVVPRMNASSTVEERSVEYPRAQIRAAREPFARINEHPTFGRLCREESAAAAQRAAGAD